MHLIDPFVETFTADREAALELLKALPIPILIDVIEEVSGRFSGAPRCSNKAVVGSWKPL